MARQDLQQNSLFAPLLAWHRFSNKEPESTKHNVEDINLFYVRMFNRLEGDDANAVLAFMERSIDTEFKRLKFRDDELQWLLCFFKRMQAYWLSSISNVGSGIVESLSVSLASIYDPDLYHQSSQQLLEKYKIGRLVDEYPSSLLMQCIQFSSVAVDRIEKKMGAVYGGEKLGQAHFIYEVSAFEEVAYGILQMRLFLEMQSQALQFNDDLLQARLSLVTLVRESIEEKPSLSLIDAVIDVLSQSDENPDTCAAVLEILRLQYPAYEFALTHMLHELPKLSFVTYPQALESYELLRRAGDLAKTVELSEKRFSFINFSFSRPSTPLTMMLQSSFFSRIEKRWEVLPWYKKGLIMGGVIIGAGLLFAGAFFVPPLAVAAVFGLWALKASLLTMIVGGTVLAATAAYSGYQLLKGSKSQRKESPINMREVSPSLFQDKCRFSRLYTESDGLSPKRDSRVGRLPTDHVSRGTLSTYGSESAGLFEGFVGRDGADSVFTPVPEGGGYDDEPPAPPGWQEQVTTL